MPDVTIADRERMARSPAHETALDCLVAGVEAAHPDRVCRDAVTVSDGNLRVEDAVYDLDASEEVVVLGGGKAAAGVAAALADLLGDDLDGGVVVTDDPVDVDGVDVVEGSHPTPDGAGMAGARRVLSRAERAGEGTLVLAVVTGGASALLPAPAGELSLADLRATTDALLASGAPIDEINAVRKHCSALKGGRLAAAAAPATVVTLAFSDVVGDDLAVVGSGPTVPDPTTYDDALAVLDRYDLDAPAAVRDHLEGGVAGDRLETPGPGGLPARREHLLATAWTAVEAARDVARERGYETLVLSSRIRGEAREQGLAHAAVAEEVAATGNPVEPPAVVLSGGETTVTVAGDGEGGPNQEFALRAALELASGGQVPGDDSYGVSGRADADDSEADAGGDSDGASDGANESSGGDDRGDEAVLAAVDTDGRDGATDAAGALVDGGTVEGPDDAAEARAALADNDAFPFLDARDAVVRTGRTGTNVNDLRVLVVT